MLPSLLSLFSPSRSLFFNHIFSTPPLIYPQTRTGWKEKRKSQMIECERERAKGRRTEKKQRKNWSHALSPMLICFASRPLDVPMKNSSVPSKLLRKVSKVSLSCPSTASIPITESALVQRCHLLGAPVRHRSWHPASKTNFNKS